MSASMVSHLAVTDTVDHLVVFTVVGVCHEAQALQRNKEEGGHFIVEERPVGQHIS